MRQQVYNLEYGEALIQEMPNGFCKWFFRPTDKRGNISNAQARLKSGKTVSKQSALTDIEFLSSWARGVNSARNKSYKNN